jgi:hypothetical protein
MGWTAKIMGAVTQVKDTGASAAIHRWLARELTDYGEVLDFSINSREKCAELHVLLKGEKEKLTVWVDQYEISSSGDQDLIIIRKARASREWVDAVLRKFVMHKARRIPREYSQMAKLLLNG